MPPRVNPPVADWMQQFQPENASVLDPTWLKAARKAMSLAQMAGLTDPAAQVMGAVGPMEAPVAAAMAGSEGMTLGKLAQKAIKAFHGSPHDFDAFSLSKIGTGEGAQAYGHGLYFAENEGVARSYKDTLAGRVGAGAKRASDSAHVAAARMMFNGGYAPDAVASVLKQAYPKASAEELSLAMHEANPGKMYEVQINADPEHFLDWDKPLAEQSQHVRERLERLGVNAGNTTKGQNALTQVSLRNPEMVSHPDLGPSPVSASLDHAGTSRLLKDAGISGIKYLDQGSRTAGEGSRNYVVFDDALVSILKKYGVAGGVLEGLRRKANASGGRLTSEEVAGAM